MSQIEQRLSDSRDENIGLLQILDNQDAQTTALKGLESRLSASLADLQALFTSTTASKSPSESDDKLVHHSSQKHHRLTSADSKKCWSSFKPHMTRQR